MIIALNYLTIVKLINSEKACNINTLSIPVKCFYTTFDDHDN